MGGFEISPPSDLTTVADAALHGWDLALRCDGCDRCLRARLEAILAECDSA